MSKQRLLAAIATEQFKNMVPYYARKFSKNPLDVLLYVVDHVLILKCEEFRTLFCEQYIPSNIDGFWKADLENHEGRMHSTWDISFNPTFLGYVTTVAYRFRSPLAYEEKPKKMIFVKKDMTKRDLQEIFAYALPQARDRNEPLTVRYHGFGRDERELWQIPSALVLSDRIVAVGGISVLEVFPNVRWGTAGKKREFVPGGLGAFDIWMMSKRLVEKLKGKDLKQHPKVTKNFWSDLMVSNETLERTTQRLEQKQHG